jgi:septal ring factor EnvC (AmiA/AmiB activator)
MTAAQELAVVPPKETALQVFQQPNGLDPWLKQIRDEIDAFVPDVSTRKGREAIASVAHRVARSKTALDGVGKELVAELKEIPKKIDGERKRMRDTLDAWRDEVRAPLNEWEAAEEARKAKHQGAIEQINLRLECRDLDSTELRQNIEWLEGMAIDESWEEFEPEALRAKDKALTALREALAAREKYEAEQAELEELRRKQAEQEQRDREAAIAREAEERAKREAEQRAQQEREAAARRELELKLQAEQAEREKLEAQQRAEQAAKDAEARAQAAAEAERQRIADEQAEAERQAKAREADKEHKASINSAALQAFIAGGMPEDCAKQAVILIAKRQIPNVTIIY